MKINKIKKALKTGLLSAAVILATAVASSVYADKVEAQELENVVTSVKLLDGNDTALSTDSNGIYQIRTGLAYRLRFEFDLSGYDGQLKNGDTFTFNINAPLDVYNNTLQLDDKDTGVNVGQAVITSNGDDNGATVTVTLSNLDAYLVATGNNTIESVSGDLAANFKVDADVTNQSISFDSNAFATPVTQVYTSKTKTGEVAGYENFSQNGGQAQRTTWYSPALASANLASTGNFYSQWRLRVNTGSQDLGSNVTLHDEVTQGSIKYIPESLVVYSTAKLNSGTSGVASLTDATKLTEGVDYTVTWNNDYSSFDIVLADGTKQYWIEYRTTTPNDGSTIANSLSVTKADGTVLTQRSDNNRTTATQTSTSLYSGTIDAGSNLVNVISEVKLLDGTDTTQSADSNGIYQLRTGLAYRLRFEFDLSKYDFVLKNGDTFSFNISAPLDVYNTTVQLADKKTDVTIGEAVITKNGDNNGATVTVTLKNLEEYLTVTGGTSVTGISGDFAVGFKVNSNITNQKIKFDSEAMEKVVTHNYTSTTQKGEVVGYENFAQNGGQAQKGNWSSDALGTTGKFYSQWRVRMNTGSQDLGSNVIVHNEVSQGSIQYIPESVEVYSTSKLTSGTSGLGTLTDAVKLTAGKDYTIKWNSNYTAYDIVLKDGTKQYWIAYKTTTPNDGTKIANSLSVTKADGTVLTQRSDNKRTVAKQESTSLYSGNLNGYYE